MKFLKRCNKLVAILLGGALLILVLISWQRRADIPIDTLKARWALGASRFVLVDGLTTHYRDEGCGPSLILLHGTGASLHTWDAWSSTLTAKGWRVVRLDLPGFGLTGPHPRSDYRIESYMEFLDHFAKQLGLSRFALVGNSLGGLIAWRYAVVHPTQVGALILIDSGGYPRGNSLPLVFRLGRWPLVATLMTHMNPRWPVEKTLRMSYGNPSMITPTLIDRYVELALRPGNRMAFAARTATRPEDHSAEIRLLRLPVLILWGEKDAIIPIADAYRFASDIPGAELRSYKDLGHVPMEEDSARTVADAQAFLASAFHG